MDKLITTVISQDATLICKCSPKHHLIIQFIGWCMLVYVSLLTEGFLKTLPLSLSLSLSLSVSSHSSQLLNGGVHTQRQSDFWSLAKFCSCSMNKTIVFYQCSSQSVPLRESRKRSREGPHQKRSRAIMALSFVNSVGFFSMTFLPEKG